MKARITQAEVLAVGTAVIMVLPHYPLAAFVLAPIGLSLWSLRRSEAFGRWVDQRQERTNGRLASKAMGCLAVRATKEKAATHMDEALAPSQAVVAPSEAAPEDEFAWLHRYAVVASGDNAPVVDSALSVKSIERDEPKVLSEVRQKSTTEITSETMKSTKAGQIEGTEIAEALKKWRSASLEERQYIGNALQLYAAGRAKTAAIRQATGVNGGRRYQKYTQLFDARLLLRRAVSGK